MARLALALVSAAAPAAAQTAADEASARELGRFAHCEVVDFVADVDVPEASGAAWFEHEGRDYVLVVSDSGGEGEAGVLALDDGAWTPLTLPLGAVSGDDIEGLATVPGGERIVGITSSGYLRTWRREGLSFALEGEARALSSDRSYVCHPADQTNCERNFEGLCLHPAPETLAGPCVGFAASKADGTLYCLVEGEQGLRLAPERAIGITGPERLTGCSFDPAPPHQLLASSNAFDMGRVRLVSGYDGPPDEARATFTGLTGPGFPEALVVVPDGLLVFSDIGVRPSRVRRFRCQDP